jgi:hypothetical protein
VPPRTELAQLLVPSWLLALLAGAALVLFAAHVPSQSHQPLIAHPRPSPTAKPGPCGQGWDVRQEAGGFTVRTIDAFLQGNPTPCTLPVTVSSGALDVHAAGDEAILSTAVTHVAATIPASGWYAVPVNPGGDALIVQPGLRGGDLTLSVVIPRR